MREEIHQIDVSIVADDGTADAMVVMTGGGYHLSLDVRPSIRALLKPRDELAPGAETIPLLSQSFTSNPDSRPSSPSI